ncbi:TonB-dependent receptor [Deminuibacter soli]|uniref:TonB-dependent receptor n=2 Tax=Deminuibacter soli TaxID=2291815 RepID=A0A3E1NRP6_9BACT|nr:TonB-dependent receptor [Deminuibacter soli]
MLQGWLSAQSITVTGIITDTLHKPISGVTVKAGRHSTLSQENGTYSIAIEPGTKTISFSALGYPQTILPVTGPTLDATLHSADNVLNDVVVVGYGTQKRNQVIGSVAQLQGSELSKRTSPQLTQSITGQLPGITVIQRSGQPGAVGASIQIRGVGSFGAGTDPLIVVDGILVTSLNNIDPNDVETFSVLKDASSAAIYGARAASGVILITTKTGRSGKFRIAYNGYAGLQKPTKLPSYAGSAEYATLINEAQPGSYTDAQVQKFRDGTDPDNYPNTNWFDATLKSSAVQTGHNLSITNGNERSQYLLSLGYLNQGGIIAKNNLQRYNARFNLTSNLSRNLKLTTRFAAIQSYDNEPSTPGGMDYSTTQDIIGQVVRYSPNYVIRKSDGSYGTGINNTGTPASALESASFYKDKSTNLESSLRLEWTILDGLKFTALASYSQVNERTTLFRATQKLTPTITDQPSSLTEGFYNNNYKTLQTFAEYHKQVRRHEFTILAGHSYESAYNETNTSFRSNLPGNDITVIDAGDASTQSNTGNAAEWAIDSYFGRLQYNFAHKYLIEGVARRDGSSRFPSTQKYGTFPSVAAGWRISEERFLKNRFSWLDELKLKASYGTLGNQNIGNYPYQRLLATGHNYSFGNTIATGVGLDTLTDSQLHWESTRTKDVGIEVSLWKQFLSFTATYFDKYTYDILVSPSSSVSSVIGLAPGVQNSGKLSNKGWEFTVNHRNTLGKFSYTVGVNFSIINNKVLDLGVGNVKQPNGLVGNGTNLFIGHPMNVYYGYVADKLYANAADVTAYTASANQSAVNPKPQPGDIRYKDISGPGGKPDGVVNAAYDRQVLGSTIPHYTYGINLGARYSDFDFSVLLQGVSGVSGYLNNYAGWAFYNTAGIQRWQADGRWSPANPNPNAAYPRLELITNQGTPNTATSSFWVVNGAYLRVKSIQLGYSLPASIARSLGIEGARFNLAAENLFTFSHYREGWDPEVNSSGAYYPILANYTLGVNVNF